VCQGPRLLVQESIYDVFVKASRKAAKHFGDLGPHNDTTQIGPIHNAKAIMTCQKNV